MRDIRGITLVALVITIIVLLILAGITISLTIGNRGILKRAREVSQDSRKAETQETIQLAIMDIESEIVSNQTGESLNGDVLVEKLPEKLQGITILKDLTGEYQEYEYYIDENYNVHIVGKSNNPITVEHTVSYVGTSKCTVKVTANSSQGNIIKYQYLLNDELKGELEESEYTIENLDPTTDYRISVIAIDEKNNSKISISSKITTKPRAYLIKDGVPLVEGETVNAKIEPREGYLEVAINSTKNRGGYYMAYDITDYNEIKVDAELIYKGQTCHTSINLYQSNPVHGNHVDGFWGTTSGTSAERSKAYCNIKEYEGNYFVTFLKNATTSATSATMYVYDLWLEQ
ncbi:MAG: fibronectin type III domain-containing protein [Clostridia bacterium]|jgi:hypothetical protein|nr:fibronectin type III domain-containing protein [Clostridia bacterium]